MKKEKACVCDLHKERKLLKFLEKKLGTKTFEKVEKVFDQKWQGDEDLEIAKAKLTGHWPGAKYGKPIKDMYEMGWIDNLTYVELAAKAANLI